jgi:hypothetical protein
MTNIVVDDGYGYLLIDGDLSILDIHDVANPQLIIRSDEYRFGSFLLNKSLIFGSSGPFSQEANVGVHVIDVHDPYQLQELRVLENINRVFGVTDDYAYATATDGLKILDISEPSIIEVIGSLPHNEAIRDAAISDNYLILITDALELYDISQPAQPKFVTSFQLFDDSFGDQIATLGDYLYVSDGLMGVWVLRIVNGEE